MAKAEKVTVKYGTSDTFNYTGYEAKEPARYVVCEDIAYFRGDDGFLWFCMEYVERGHFAWQYSGNAEMQNSFTFGGTIPDEVRAHDLIICGLLETLLEHSEPNP